MSQNLYRHFNKDGELLYVGVSLNHLVRLSQHKASSPWFSEITNVTIETFEDRKKVLEAETSAIVKEKPKYNIRKVNEEKKHTSVEDSIQAVTTRLVSFYPLYTIKDLETILNIGYRDIERLIDSCKLGHIKMPKKSRVNKYGKTTKDYKVMVSGWQVIDFIENLTMGTEK